ncbi:MAG: peptide deformylase [Roseiflexus sp.]|jgi:peptide deformylase|nr:peptide deformylase [Roseiflexus sp.]MBO9364185.1 peptide deformylase [Roseiflexus sp.]MBO9381951.1 peptide deformylase [Roseiflexus sp.]MBO9388522.1 peptide deformylase [Roseiflexus sp.]
MALRRILRIDNPDDKKILTTRCHPVRLPNPALKQLVADMVETMRAANGVGLAAPQIGVLQRLAVISIPPVVEERPDGSKIEVAPEQNFVLINPEIIKASDQEDVGLEGCLSLPGWYGEVPRAAWVTVEYTDLNGRRQRIRRATGLLGRALQHEIDHLDGILFTERIRDLSTLKDYSEEMAPTAAE